MGLNLEWYARKVSYARATAAAQASEGTQPPALGKNGEKEQEAGQQYTVLVAYRFFL